MAFLYQRSLVASARRVIRWCSSGPPWELPNVNPNNFAGRWYEPAYVASFVLFGIPRLAEEWSPELDAAGYGLRITGVFCHQSPKVEMSRSQWTVDEGECELGDLLVVHDHFAEGSTIPTRRAVLAQAKMQRGKSRLVDNPRQAFLYEHWPVFRITKPGIFEKRDWNLEDNREGARYAEITPEARRRYLLLPRSPWALRPCAPAAAGPGSAEDMASFLVSMLDLNGRARRGRPAMTEGDLDDWSALIDEMLRLMKVRDFADKQLLGRHRGPRLVTRFAGNQTSAAAFQFVCSGASAGEGGEGPEPVAPEGAGPGISTVLIETFIGPD